MDSDRQSFASERTQMDSNLEADAVNVDDDALESA